MEPLPKVITRKGFVYTQIERTDEKAIYRQEQNGILIGHEIFYIRHDKEREIMGKLYPASEGYPGETAFGVSAWSVGRNLEMAIKKYNDLQPVQHKA